MSSTTAKRPGRQTCVRQQARHYDAQNLQAALVIVGDSRAFPEGCLSRLWAQRVIARLSGNGRSGDA
jgi:hypothetical protein